MAITLNQQEYAWGEIQVWIFGQAVAGCRGIDYKSSKAKEHLHAAGRNPRSIQHGKYTYDGTLTLLSSEVEALNRSARAQGYKSLLDVEFDIVIVYASNNGMITTNKVVCASVTEIPRAHKEGDLYTEIALPFLALDIQEGI